MGGESGKGYDADQPCSNYYNSLLEKKVGKWNQQPYSKQENHQ